MRKVIVRAVGAAVGAATMAGVANAEEAASIEEAISEGELILHARARYETLEQAGQNDADALTLRTRVGWKTATWNGFTGLVEFEDVRDLGGDYNDGLPPAEPYATIADPQGTELNRLQLRWQMNQHFAATIGRQTVEFDDKRFLDGSNARQDTRTLDALRGDLTMGAFKAAYVYVDHVNNTTAEYNDLETEGHLLNASYTFSEQFKLTGFMYALDFDTASAINQSSNTIGVRATGEFKAFGVDFDYAASVANQRDYGNATVSYDLDYWQASLSAELGEWSGRVWYESLGGDGTRGFFVPLGSSNNFQGWASAFTTKPADGVNDFNVTLQYEPEWAPESLEGLTFMVRYYDFEAERTGVDFGNELDMSVGAEINDRTNWSLEYADYEPGDAPSPAERTRVRFMVQYTF